MGPSTGGRWAAHGGWCRDPASAGQGACRQLRTRRRAAGIGKHAVDGCVAGGRMKRTNSSAGGDGDVKALAIAGDAVESLAQQVLESGRIAGHGYSVGFTVALHDG